MLQGTGFFALQSCMNHSCEPNAATEGEPSGEVRREGREEGGREGILLCILVLLIHIPFCRARCLWGALVEYCAVWC